MTERSQRLYDCITEIGDRYLDEALEEPEKKTAFPLKWKTWTALAASVLLAAGIGLMLPMMNLGMGGKSEAPAASAPAASIPAALEPGLMDQETAESVTDVSSVGGGSGTAVKLTAGQRVCYPDGRVGVLLSEEKALEQGVELDCDLPLEPPLCWLEYRDGMYRPAESPTEIALYVLSEGVDMVSDGENCFVISQVSVP